MADYDLTQKIIPYLDRHLVFPLLIPLADSGHFSAEELQAAQYELAKGTNMYEYEHQLFTQIHPDQEETPEFREKRERVAPTHERLQEEARAVLDVIENPEVAQALRQDKNQNLQYLKENYNLTSEQIKVLYNCGKFQYSCGNYSGAADYLYHYLVLSTDVESNISASWGRLASDILSGQWDIALEELNTLKDLIESHSKGGAYMQLHARTWLVHWSLFIYFNHPQGRSVLLETFLSPTYLNTIQTSCPWILRYLAVAGILSRRSSTSSRVRNSLKDIVKAIQTETYQYSDPVTSFLSSLYEEFDFEKAQIELQKAEKVVSEDFFTKEWASDFLENARFLVTECFCGIYREIDIGDLSDRLNLSRDEGEKWIVNLIRETRMGGEAKIDLEKNIIHINRPPQPVYQSVIEKTRGLALRTQAMGSAVARSGVVVSS